MTPIKIIHADDHKLYRTGVKNALSGKPGIEYIGEAGNGQELLQLLEYLQPDIVILNIQMPVMDGLATLPILKKRYPAIKVIMLSMHNDPKVILRFIESGASTYFTKAAESAEIYSAILALRDSWFYPNETVVKALWHTLPFPERPLPAFSDKEQKIAHWLLNGHSLEQIAAEADLSPRTVAAVIDKLKAKTYSRDMNDLLAYIRDGLHA